MNISSKPTQSKAWRIILTLTLLVSTLGFVFTPARADEASRTFPATGKTVSGRFLDYWDANGGLAQQGYPISNELQEKSDVDGNTYTVQYFERALFEYHPENEPPNDVLLALIGSYFYNLRYNGDAPGQKVNTSGPLYFPETGKSIGRYFRHYWEDNGGLAQQGYPISNEFLEKSPVDGRTYTVQYFERAVFELHPGSEVKLSLLGAAYYNQRHPGGAPSPGVTPQPTPEPSWLLSSGWTHAAAATNNIMVFYNTANGAAFTARVNDDGSLTELQHFPNSKGNPFLTKGMTHIVAGPDDLLYFYKSSTGAEFTVRVREDGSLGIGQAQQWNPNWTSITVDPETRIALFYNYQSGVWSTNIAKADGSFVPLHYDTNAQPGGTRWSYITAVGNGNWLIIVNVSGKDQVWTVSFNVDDGLYLLKGLVEYPHSVFTSVVSDGTRMLFLNKDSGDALTAKVDADGTFTLLKSTSGWNKWSLVVGTSNRVMVFYKEDPRLIATITVNDDGSYKDLKQY